MTLIGQFRFLGEFCVCPLKQIGFFHFVHADIGLAGLEDGHADGIDVVDVIEDFQGTQGIQHHLGICHGADLDALAMFVIADVHHTVSDNDAVGSAKAVLNPTGEVHPLFNHDHRISAGLLCRFQEFHHIGGISSSAFLHFLVVPGEIFDGVFRGHPQSLLQTELAEGVGIGALGGIVTAFILVVLAEPSGRRTVEPPFGRGC